MKKIATILLTLTIILSTILALSGCKNIARNIPKDVKFDESKYVQTFFDDFNGDKLDNTRYRIFTGDKDTSTNRTHVHRGAYYSDDEDIIFLKDGKLHISTVYKKGEYGTGWYSAWIETTSNNVGRAFEDTPDNYVGFAQKYGYFEIRCIAPPAEGMWSAFWLVPNEGKGLTQDDIQWTATDGCEVDIMESQNYFRKKPYVQHVIHSDYGSGKGVHSDKSPIFKVPDMYTQFHTYGVEWTPEKFIFYIDGYKTYETKNIVDNKVLGTPNVAQSMILSVEIAGYEDKNGPHVGIDKETGKETWLGSMNNMDKSKNYDFIVDYVKVMKKK